jgi:hypothetical protein
MLRTVNMAAVRNFKVTSGKCTIAGICRLSSGDYTDVDNTILLI